MEASFSLIVVDTITLLLPNDTLHTNYNVLIHAHLTVVRTACTVNTVVRGVIT